MSRRARLTPLRRRAAPMLVAAALATLAACTDVTAPRTPDAGGSTTSTGAGFPGFDLAVYPGDAAMRAWAPPSSPYQWVGYYLPAPCHRDSTFVGKRRTIATFGYGVAVLYVGQQTWDGVALDAAAHARTAALAATASAATCSRTLLSAAQGDDEARDAVARTAAEGFPAGTAIFLDLEPMQVVTDAMKSYYRAWAARVLADGRYRPGVYAHFRNADELYADVAAVYAAARAAGRPPFWIARVNAFSLLAAPTGAGFGFAAAWQGALDVTRTWNGVTLRIDESVADTRSPSGSPGA